jgi:hypothetical protein
MADKRPPHHPPFRRAGSGERFPNDHERANKARQAAEALFAPKPRENEAPNLATGPLTERRAPARYEVLPAAVRNERDIAPIGGAPPVRPPIPAAHAARIRTWLRYGMTIADVATVYGVGVGDIEQLLRKG